MALWRWAEWKSKTMSNNLSVHLSISGDRALVKRALRKKISSWRGRRIGRYWQSWWLGAESGHQQLSEASATCKRENQQIKGSMSKLRLSAVLFLSPNATKVQATEANYTPTMCKYIRCWIEWKRRKVSKVEWSLPGFRDLSESTESL